MLAACARDILASNIQFSAKVVGDNTIARMPGEPGHQLFAMLALAAQ
jgi:hypothetical protein